jgi:hypothetical protein
VAESSNCPRVGGRRSSFVFAEFFAKDESGFGPIHTNGSVCTFTAGGSTMNASPVSMRSAAATAGKADAHRKRAERRVAHRVPCHVRAPDNSYGKAVSVVGQTVNLSANGLAVQVGLPMDQGARVEILLPQLDGEPTRLVGRVAHSRRVLTGTFEIGIRIEPELAVM